MNNINSRKLLYIRILWGVFISIFILIILIFVLISTEKFGDMPGFEQLENPENNIASEIYSEDNVLIGTPGIQNRTYVNFSDLSPNLVNALIATEDIRFTKHSGIDPRGLARVIVKTILLGQSQAGGGSTISQQLAKNLYDTREESRYNPKIKNRKVNLVITKFKEWVTAVKLERSYTKEEIILMYLNTVFFGSNAYGIKAASQTFFNTSPDSLKLEEAAVLVGVLKAQTMFNPKRNPDTALFRRNVVLSQMLKYGYINKSTFDSIAKIPIILDFKVQDHQVGIATYFRQHLKMYLTATKPKRKQYYSYSQYRNDSLLWRDDPLFGWCNKNTKPNDDSYNLYSDGLKIYTTINSKMQMHAEKAVEKHLKETLQPAFFKLQENNKDAPFSLITDKEIENIMLRAMRRSERYYWLKFNLSESEIIENFNTPAKMKIFTWEGEKDTIMTPFDSIRYYKHLFKASLLSMEPTTGHVKAYVGGPNFKYFKYDMVTLGKRQVGSTVKPFLYVLAMQEGHTPCKQVANVPTTFIVGDSTWTPKNSSSIKMVGKMVSLKWGLANSANYVSAWLMKQYNPPAVIDIMRKLGIKSYVAPVYSMFLGPSEITLEEMTGAFNTFSNKGVYVSPLYVTRIEDKNGNVLATFKPKKLEVISEESAYLMTSLLQEVVNRGTAGRLRYKYLFKNEMGGKTGTTQNFSDGWYMGITPELVTGVWCGAEDRSVHFDSGQGTGAAMALPIWAHYMKSVYDDKELHFTQKNFDKPRNFNIELDCEKFESINNEPYEDEPEFYD